MFGIAWRLDRVHKTHFVSQRDTLLHDQPGEKRADPRRCVQRDCKPCFKSTTNKAKTKHEGLRKAGVLTPAQAVVSGFDTIIRVDRDTSLSPPPVASRIFSTRRSPRVNLPPKPDTRAWHAESQPLLGGGSR